MKTINQNGNIYRVEDLYSVKKVHVFENEKAKLPFAHFIVERNPDFCYPIVKTSSFRPALNSKLLNAEFFIDFINEGNIDLIIENDFNREIVLPIGNGMNQRFKGKQIATNQNQEAGGIVDVIELYDSIGLVGKLIEWTNGNYRFASSNGFLTNYDRSQVTINRI